MSLQITDEQRQQIYNEMKAQEEAKLQKRDADRKDLKEITSETVTQTIQELMVLSAELELKKKLIFESFEIIKQMKRELYPVSQKNMTDTFSSLDGKYSITMGFRTVDKYDDTVSEGMALIRGYMDSLGNDPKLKPLLGMVNGLLKRDKLGNFKTNRLIELENWAKEEKAAMVLEGVNILKEALHVEKSVYFITAQYKTDEIGTWKGIPLSISAAPYVPKPAQSINN